MTNLPSKKNGSTHLSAERVEHREWIGGRALTLLSHYWRDDDPVQLTAAIGADWANVLEGLPQRYIDAACVAYLRDEPDRKPKPGHIYQRAKALMPRPEIARYAEPERPPAATEEQAAQILKDAGVKVDENGKVVAL